MRKPIHLPLGKGLRIFFGLAYMLSFGPIAAQPCPSFLNCPQSTPTYCDESTNNLSLWNYPPFTLSPTNGNADLHEGPIDLNIKVKGCSGGGLTSISFLLFLDLDNDDHQETVLMSSNLPPGGRVFANNSFNPGYSGGDTVWFDQRALPDSMLYRFSLEIAYSGDTTTGWLRYCTEADPYDFTPVILPEGRHRMEWRVSQDGVDRFCDRNFKVKDCKKPNVACKQGMAVYLDVTQMASLSLTEALQSVSDNITPDTQLVLGMRRVGSGFGFPLDGMGNPQDTVMFNCQNDSDKFIEIWAMDRAGNLENCSAKVLVYDTAGFCPFIPYPSVCARTYWNQQIIGGVSFSTAWTAPNQQEFVNPLALHSNGCTELNMLPPTSLFSLRAFKDTLPLNGVTTYDLVLISKHILALETFDEGWKIAAADVNQSNSVTTFDIVELRKLILGLSNKLPNGTPSWKFYVDTCTVWGNPFYGYCPVAYSLPVQAISSYPPNLSFSGIKMGDVNATASSLDTLQGLAETRGQAFELELSDIDLSVGEIIEIPVRAMEAAQWEGFQFSLMIDPKILEIQEVVPNGGIALNLENWAILPSGEFNMSWSDAIPTTLLPEDVLFHLRVKAHADVRLSDVLTMLNKTRIQPEAYDPEGVPHPLQLVFSEKPAISESINAQVFPPTPNPTTGSSRLPLRLNESEIVSLEIFDPSGRLSWRHTVSLEPGTHFLEIPASAIPESGVYVWRVYSESLMQSGRLLRH
ncbi:MAG: hypothetical protein ACKVT2_15890 [Saprospiraceae bacterium]